MKAAGLEDVRPEKFVRHDLRRSWSSHAKGAGSFSVEEACFVLGHSPEVNVSHYSQGEDLEQLKVKMKNHPSNVIKISENLVTHWSRRAKIRAGSKQNERAVL